MVAGNIILYKTLYNTNKEDTESLDIDEEY